MSLMDILDALDKPRQAVWNFAEGVGDLFTGKGDVNDVLMAIPGALGGFAGGALSATGFGLPLAVLGGSLVGGGLQSLPFARRAMTPDELINRMGFDAESDTGTIGALALALATDPLSFAVPGGAAAANRGARTAAGRVLGRSADEAATAGMTPYSSMAGLPDDLSGLATGAKFTPGPTAADESLRYAYGESMTPDRYMAMSGPRANGMEDFVPSYLGDYGPPTIASPARKIPRPTGFEYDPWMAGYDPDLAMRDPVYAAISSATRDLPRDGLDPLRLIEQRSDLGRGINNQLWERSIGEWGSEARPPAALSREAARLVESMAVDRAAMVGKNFDQTHPGQLMELVELGDDIAAGNYQLTGEIESLMGRRVPTTGYPISEASFNEVIRAVERAGFRPDQIDMPLLEGRALARSLMQNASDLDEAIAGPLERMVWGATSVDDLPAEVMRFFNSPQAAENLMRAMAGSQYTNGMTMAMADGARRLGMPELEQKILDGARQLIGQGVVRMDGLDPIQSAFLI